MPLSVTFDIASWRQNQCFAVGNSRKAAKKTHSRSPDAPFSFPQPAKYVIDVLADSAPKRLTLGFELFPQFAEDSFITMRVTPFRIRAGAMLLGLLGLIVAGSCLPKPLSESGGNGGVNITLYGFSIMKEPLEKAIYPAFAAKAKREHNININFTSSFAGSETVTNQILQGVKAQIAILSIERDAQRLQQSGFATTDWHNLPQKGIVNKTPFVILVRKGNPKGIHDFADLAKPGIKLIHPRSEEH